MLVTSTDTSVSTIISNGVGGGSGYISMSTSPSRVAALSWVPCCSFEEENSEMPRKGSLLLALLERRLWFPVSEAVSRRWRMRSRRGGKVHRLAAMMERLISKIMAMRRTSKALVEVSGRDGEAHLKRRLRGVSAGD